MHRRPRSQSFWEKGRDTVLHYIAIHIPPTESNLNQAHTAVITILPGFTPPNNIKGYTTDTAHEPRCEEDIDTLGACDTDAE